MKTKLKKMKNRPQILISLFGSVILAVAILFMTYLYDTKSEEMLYSQLSDQVSAINKIKIHALSFFLDFRKSDVQALASRLLAKLL